MSDTIDKLIFALDGDLSGLERAYAQAEAQSAKTGKTIQQNIGKGLDETAASAKKNGAEIERAIGGTEQASVKAGVAMEALRAKYDPAFASAQKLAQSQKELNQLVSAGVLSSAAAAKVMKELGDATTHSHGSVAVATREFRAFFDEVSSGRTRQTPGTLAIIATRVFGISGATLAWGAALAAIPVGLAAAAFMSEQAMSRVDEALRRTGNQAGTTRDAILSMAKSGIPGLSETGSLGVLGILASRGNINPGQLPDVARAVPGYARASGQSTDKAAEELEKLLADPAKGATQLNEEFKLLDISTTKQILHLEESGQLASAQALLIKGLNERFNGLAEASWSLAKGFDGLWNGVKNAWFHTGSLFTGADQTKQQEVDALKSYNDKTLKGLAGLGYPDPHAALARNPGIGINQGGAIEPLRNIMSDFDANAQKITKLQKEIADANAAAASGRAHAVANSAVGFGLKIAETYDEQASKAKKLGEQLSALNLAIDSATGKNVQYRAQLIRERDAVDTALKNQRTPAQIAAEEADDQRRIAAAPEDKRNTLRAQLAAQRERERNLANPTTAPFAEAVYQSQMSVAALNNRDLNKDAAEAKRQDEHLAKAKAEGEAQMVLARAYDHGAASVAALRAAQEAHVAVAAKEIRASQESAYALALQDKAYGAANVAVSEKISKDREASADLRKMAAAGGDPIAVAKARIDAEAMAATFEMRANARTKEQIALADKKLGQLRDELTLQQRLNREISTNEEIRSRGRELANIRGQLGAVGAGAGPDQMRHLEVQQRAIDDLIRRGYDPATAEFQKQLKILLPLNIAISDANDKLNKMRQEVTELATGITGPLKNFLRNGGNPLDMLAEMGQNTLDTLVQHEILDPLQKGLEGLFGGILGAPKNLLGTSPATPMYVQDVSLGGLGGGGGGGGLSSLFGGGGGGGGFLDNIFGGGIGEANGGGDFIGTGSGSGWLSDMFNGSWFGGGSSSMLGAGLGDLFGGGAAAGAGVGEAFGGGDFIGTASSAADGADWLSSILSFAGLFDEGGTIGPGQWGIKSGMPEIIQGGMHGVSIEPLTAPIIKAAAGAMGRGPGSNSNPGGPGNGGPGSMRQGDTHFWNITTPNVDSFIRSKSQVQARFTMAAAQGQRNT